MLGKACNLKCIYCLQGQEKPAAFDTAVAPKTVAGYFPKDGKYDVILYGGEPLLYFDYVVALADAIKERNPSVQLRTITNGTLLTVERAKKLNELGFGVGVSHDGYSFEATRRTRDFLKHNPEPFLTLERRTIGATITTVNASFYDVWDYFEEFSRRNGTKREAIHISIAGDVEDNTDAGLLISPSQGFEAMLNRVFVNLEKAILANDFEAYEFTQYLPMMRTLHYRLGDPQGICAWCGADLNVCHIDTRGNLYPCHNVEVPNGHVSEAGIQPGRYNPHIATEKCRACPAFIYCGGGCVACSPETHEAHCYVQYQQVVRMLGLLQKLKDRGW